MKNFLKRIPGIGSLSNAAQKYIKSMQIDQESLNQQIQQILINQHRTIFLQQGKTLDDISDAGFRCYSQFEEDGIILYVLSIIGMKTKKVVEICIGNGEECMATNLILNHGFEGYLFDGDPKRIDQAKEFFYSKKDCQLTPPRLMSAWITRENINQLLSDIGVHGEIDLLSLDIDGNDYYVWDAISQINPRLCIFETHNIVPGDMSITIPYADDFNCWKREGPGQDFRSASLLAMKKLSERKGYRLIGAHKHGFNVFFLRNDIAESFFPEVSIEQVHDNIWTRRGQLERWPAVKEMPWVQV